MAVDLILTFFSTKSIKGCDLSCSTPIHLLKNPTELFSFDGFYDPSKQDTEKWVAWARTVRNMATGRILPKLVDDAKKALKIPADEKIGRIATITFSAGRYMNSEILRHPEDRAAVDTVIDLDGLNMPLVNNSIYMPAPDSKGNYGIYQFALPGLGPWFEYGKLCFDGSHLLVNWHTQVPGSGPSVSSTRDACNLLHSKLEEYALANGIELKPQSYNIEDFRVPSEFFPANTPAQGGDTARTWTEMPEITATVCGNNWKIDMPGNSGGAHIFSCHWGQAAVWRALLAPRWNASGATSWFTNYASNFNFRGGGGSEYTSVDNDSLLADLANFQNDAASSFGVEQESIPTAVATVDSQGNETEFTSSYTDEPLSQPAVVAGLQNAAAASMDEMQTAFKVIGLGAGVAVGFFAAKSIFGRRR